MSAFVTERPRAPFESSLDNSGTKVLNGRRVLDVTGATSLADAVAAIGGSPWNIDYGEAYDTDNPSALVRGITNTFNRTAGMYTFEASYSNNNNAFTGQPAKVKVRPYLYQSPYEYDVDGVPYETTSLVPFDPPMMRDFIGVEFTVRVVKAKYDVGLIFTYGNKTNSTALTIPGPDGGYTIPIGCARFIPPEMDFQATDASTTFLDLKFDCREKKEHWKKNVIDQAAMGWGVDGASKKVKGLFATDSADSGPAGVVRLDGTGKPLDATNVSKIVLSPTGHKVAVTSPPTTSPSAAVLDTTNSTDTLKILSFRQLDSADLNEIFAA